MKLMAVPGGEGEGVMVSGPMLPFEYTSTDGGGPAEDEYEPLSYSLRTGPLYGEVVESRVCLAVVDVLRRL